MTHPHDMDGLMSRYLGGEALSAAELAGLEAWLLSNPDHADAFAELGLVDQLLVSACQQDTAESLLALLIEQESMADIGRPVDITPLVEGQPTDRVPPTKPAVGGASPRPTVIVIPRAVAWLAVAAAVAVVAGLIFYARDSDGPAEPDTSLAELAPAPQPHVVVAPKAVLLEEVGARWGPDAPSPIVGQPFGDGVYQLRAGLVRIEMGQGATVIVEGPARLEPVSANGLALKSGRVTADVPEGAYGFTIFTPSAKVTDLGTSFGVDVAPDAQTFAQVFAGKVAMSASTPTAGDGAESTLLIKTGQAAQVDAAGTRIDSAEAVADRFVRRGHFDGLANRGGEQARHDAIRWLWQRNRSLIAAESFALDPGALSYGWSGAMRRLEGDSRVVTDASVQPLDSVAEGGRLAIEAGGLSTLFFDLDLSPGSKADRAGLIVPGRQAIGADGMRVCISWTAGFNEGELATPPIDGEWLGLSLFAGGDDRENDELIFFGMCADTGALGVLPWRAAPGSPRLEREVTPLGRDGSPLHQLRARRWLVVIDCLPGPDRLSVYLDPDPGQLGSPDVVVDDVDIQFDRVRFEGNLGATGGVFDGLRIGADVDSVLIEE